MPLRLNLRDLLNGLVSLVLRFGFGSVWRGLSIGQTLLLLSDVRRMLRASCALRSPFLWGWSFCHTGVVSGILGFV